MRKNCVYFVSGKKETQPEKKNIKEIHFQVFVDKHYAYKHTQTHSYTHISILKQASTNIYAIFYIFHGKIPSWNFKAFWQGNSLKKLCKNMNIWRKKR